jgi:Ca-activated chloride channel family protein
VHFNSPLWLVVLLLVAALLIGYIVIQLRRTRYVVRFSNVALLASVAPKRSGWPRHVAFGLLLGSLALLTVGAAQPTATTRIPRDQATIMLALDVSPSMIATDVAPNRLLASEAGAKLFLTLLPPTINLGLVTFGGVASVDVPPTLNRAAVRAAIDNIQTVQSTAIGEAVFTCLDAIHTFQSSSTPTGSKPIPGRIVLMSDGTNNNGRSVADAEAAANAAAVPVSTIAFGTDDGTIDYNGQIEAVPADKATLRELATSTGGSYHTAASAQELRSVYQDIGSQIGYVKGHKVVSWNFLASGLLLAFGAAGAAIAWSARLP